MQLKKHGVVIAIAILALTAVVLVHKQAAKASGGQAFAQATLSPSVYPLDHGYRQVTINNVTDANGNALTLTGISAICQDEPTNFENIPAYSIDGTGVGASIANVRAEYSGTRINPSNGRVYHVFFGATDADGNLYTGQTLAGIPVPNSPAIDGGALYDSTKSSGACVIPN
jgi:hypothetical protein